MDAGRPRFEAAREEQQELAARFFGALTDGNVDVLRELLAADASMVGDGGGKAPALARAVTGADPVARLLASAYPRMALAGVTFEPHDINGLPGAVFHDRDGRVLHTLALEVADGRIRSLLAVINPDKLGHVGPVADVWAVNDEVRRAGRRSH